MKLCPRIDRVIIKTANSLETHAQVNTKYQHNYTHMTYLLYCGDNFLKYLFAHTVSSTSTTIYNNNDSNHSTCCKQ